MTNGGYLYGDFVVIAQSIFHYELAFTQNTSQGATCSFRITSNVFINHTLKMQLAELFGAVVSFQMISTCNMQGLRIEPVPVCITGGDSTKARAPIVQEQNLGGTGSHRDFMK